MKKTLRVFTSRVSAVIILFAFVGGFLNKACAQNAIVGSDFSSGWGSGCGSNANFKYMSASAGTSYIVTSTAAGTGNRYWRMGIDWSGTQGQYNINGTGGPDFNAAMNTTYTLNGSCTSNGAFYYNVGSTSYNYIFKSANPGTTPGSVVFFEVQGTVRTVSTVTQSPTTSSVYPGASVTVTANLSGSFSTGQAVFLRYTTNAWSTSTVVNMTGSGTVYTASIPASSNTAGNPVSYYVFTSGPAGGGLASNGSNADLYTINLNNNSGSNYSYTVNSSYITTQNGDWNTGATWLTGSVPPAGVATIVNNVVTCNFAVSNAPSSVTINSGQSLTFANAAGALTTTTLTNNGTVAWTAAGNLTIAASGTFTNNATVTPGTGTVTFTNAGTINGSATTFNNLTLTTGTLTLSTVPTINGTLAINGGNLTAAPIYGASSTLAYGVTYTRYIEWTATLPGIIGTTAGYPNNVTVNTGTLTLYNAGQTGGGAMAGTMTIGSGTTFSMAGYRTDTMSVGGSWSDAGTFTPGTAVVSMAGGAAQTITKTGGESFYGLTINNTSGGVALGSNVTVTNALTLTKGILTSTGYALAVTNTSNAAISAGAQSPSTYVAGPLTWSLANASGSNYLFPVGAGGNYLPFTLNSPTGTSPVVTIKAVGSTPSGSADGSTLSGSLAGEYWTATFTGTYSSGTVSLLQQSSLGSLNAIARSSSNVGAGTFASLGGTVSGNSINNSTTTGSTLGSFTFGTLGTPAPTVTAVAAGATLNSQGVNTGYIGQSINITGTNFPSNATVTFNGTAAYPVTWNSDTSLTAVVNAGTSTSTGTVVVTNPTTLGTGSASFTGLGYISAASTDWNTASTWLDGAAVGIPVLNSTVTIVNAVTVNASITNAPATLTVTSGNSLTFGASGALTVNTTLTNAGNIVMTSGGTLTIAASGTLTNNGTYTGGTGTLNFAGAGTLNGSTAASLDNLTINTGTVTLTTVPAINGIFTINGGSVSAAPIYTSNSTLLYNVGYSRFNEWNASGVGTIGTTAGYPNNVRVSNNSSLDVANGVAGTTRAMAGSLTVDAGSTLTLNGTAMTAPLIVGANVNLAGTITLSSASGGDIKLGGNWTFTAGGTFNPNARAVFFTGASKQTISRSAAGTLNFDYLINSNTSGGIQLAGSPATSVNVNAPNGGNGLSWSSSTTNFDLNGNSLYLTANQSIGISGADNFTSSAGTGFVTINTGTVSSVSGSGSLAFSSAVTVALYGGMNFGSGLSTINGTLQIEAGGYVTTNAPFYASGSLLQYNSATTPYARGIEWSAGSGAGYPYNVQISNNTTLAPGGNSNTGTVLNMAGSLTIDAGSSFYMDYGGDNMTVPLDLLGNINLNGNLSESGVSGGDVNLGGNWINNGSGTNFFANGRSVGFIGSSAQTLSGTNATAAAYAFSYLAINNSSGGVTLSKPITVANTLTMINGNLTTTTTNTLTIAGSGATSGGSTTSFVKGPLNWTLPSGLSSSANVYAFPIGSGATYLPISITTVSTGATGPDLQMQAFNSNCGGSAGTGLSSISTTEYWQASVISGNYTSASISATRQSSVGASGVLGESSTATGSYAYLAGTASGNSVNNSNVSGAGFYVISTSVAAPAITSVVPTSPAVSGQANNTGYIGQTLTINGTNFPSNATVTIGGVAAVSTSYISSTQLTAVVAASGTGSTLVVTNPTTLATAGAAFTNLGYITNANTDWNTASTWLGGSVPPTGATTTVNTNITVNATVSNNPSTVTVNSGSKITFGASGNLSISTSLTFAGTIDMTSGGTLNFTSNGTFTNNGTFTYGTGTVNFTGNAGTSSVLGSNATTFYNVSITGPTAGINFGNPPSPTNSTVTNNFTIGAGGFVVLHAPNYASGSTLVYNTGSGYNRNVEWSQTSNPAYPYNVLVTGNTTLNMSFGSGLSNSTARAMSGTLTINGGSTVTMNAMTATMTTGSLVNNGTLTLSSSVGGDYVINGNWTNSGAFTSNSRAVQFSGSSAQTITGATTFDYLTIDNGSGVSLNSSINVNTTLTFTAGKLILGTNNLTLASGATIAGAGASAYVETNGTGQMKETVGSTPVFFTVGNSAYNPIVLTNTGTSDVYGINVLDGTFTANNNTKVVDRRWQVTEAVSGGSNLAVKLQWNTGEEASNFLSGTNDYIGFYNSSAWSENPATQSGSNPYVFTSSSNFTPTNLTTGTQYFALGKDNAFLCASLVAPVISKTDVTCNGGANGTVTVSTLPTGGLSPYTYSLNGGAYQSSVSFAGLAANAYSVVARDNNGCTSPTSNPVTISQPAVLTATISGGTSPVCYNASPGTFTATGSGATGSYTYQWYNGAGAITGETANTYAPGNLTSSNSYYCAVTSGSCGTSNTSILSITVYANLAATISGGTSPLCYNTSPAAFTASASGGSGTYTYQWYNSGGAIAGQTGSIYSPGNLTSSDAYYCAVTGGVCGITNTSNSAVTVSASINATASNGGPYLVTQTISLSSGPGGQSGYSWSGPSSYTASGQTATRTGATTAMAGVYTVTITNSDGCTASANTTVAVTTAATYTWTGLTNTDWAVATNWSPNSAIGGPNATGVDVIIPNVTNKPVLATSVTVGNLQIDANAQLTLNADINIYKNWVGGSGGKAVIAGTGVLILNGVSAQTISGQTQVQEIRLSNSTGAVLQSGSVLDVFTSLDLQTGNFNATNGALTFKSNSVTNVGILDNFSSGYTGTLSGAISAERYYASSSTYDQHFIGSPVNAPSLAQFGVNGTAGFVSDPTCDETRLAAGSAYSNIFSLNESNGAVCGMQQWQALNSGNVQNGKGYSYRQPGSGTLTLNGAANLSSSYTISGLLNSGWSNTTLQGHAQTSGWQLVSNPYLATLSLSSMAGGLDYQIEIWNANGPFAGTYQPGTVGTDAVIAPFQAFMIHKTSPGGSAAFSINASDRVRTARTFYAQNANQLNIVAANINTGQLDQTTVAFSTMATDTFDVQYDAAKFPGALNRHTLYTENNGKWMSRNVLHDIAGTSTIPMGFEPGANSTYKLSFNGLNTFDPTSYIYLEDKALNVMYNVRNGDYTFTADSADNWNRFVLHFTPATQITSADASCNTSGIINIQQPGTADWNYTLTDSSSAIITSGTLNQNQQVTVGVAAGTYTLTLIDTNNYTVVKTILVNGPEMITAGFHLSNDVVQVGQTVTLTSITGNANSYQWSFGNGTSATGANTSVSYTQPGVYTVSLMVTNQSGCSAVKTQTITVNAASATGLNNISGTNNLNIWSHGNRIYVDFTALQAVDATVVIYDILGQQISNEKVTNNLGYQKEVNNIEAAYMIVMVKEGDNITTRKVFIANSK